MENIILLLKQYLEANAGRKRIVKRRELEDLLKEHDMPVEKKTLYQDFAALGDVCGLRLEYDVLKKSIQGIFEAHHPGNWARNCG